jgi:hypothetical protein
VAVSSLAQICGPACLETIRRAILGDVESQLRALWGVADEYARLGEHDRADEIRRELAGATPLTTHQLARGWIMDPCAPVR